MMRTKRPINLKLITPSLHVHVHVPPCRVAQRVARQLVSSMLVISPKPPARQRSIIRHRQQRHIHTPLLCLPPFRSRHFGPGCSCLFFFFAAATPLFLPKLVQMFSVSVGVQCVCVAFPPRKSTSAHVCLPMSVCPCLPMSAFCSVHIVL